PRRSPRRGAAARRPHRPPPRRTLRLGAGRGGPARYQPGGAHLPQPPLRPPVHPQPGGQPRRRRALEARRRPVTGLHHLELWVPDLAEARRSWGWLLSELGWTVADLGGTMFEAHHDDVYLFVEQSPALSTAAHDRMAGACCSPSRPDLADLGLVVPDSRRGVPFVADTTPRSRSGGRLSRCETDRDRPGWGGLDPGQEASQCGLRHGDLDGVALAGAAQDYPVGRHRQALRGRGLPADVDGQGPPAQRAARAEGQAEDAVPAQLVTDEPGDPR